MSYKPGCGDFTGLVHLGRRRGWDGAISLIPGVKIVEEIQFRIVVGQVELVVPVVGWLAAPRQ